MEAYVYDFCGMISLRCTRNESFNWAGSLLSGACLISNVCSLVAPRDIVDIIQPLRYRLILKRIFQDTTRLSFCGNAFSCRHWHVPKGIMIHCYFCQLMMFYVLDTCSCSSHLFITPCIIWRAADKSNLSSMYENKRSNLGYRLPRHGTTVNLCYYVVYRLGLWPVLDTRVAWHNQILRHAQHPLNMLDIIFLFYLFRSQSVMNNTTLYLNIWNVYVSIL